MNKGLFDLTGFESKNDDDIIEMNINESTDDVSDFLEAYKKLTDDQKEIIKKIAKDRNVNKNEIYKKFI